MTAHAQIGAKVDAEVTRRCRWYDVMAADRGAALDHVARSTLSDRPYTPYTLSAPTRNLEARHTPKSQLSRL
jgi:hypothetical protein